MGSSGLGGAGQRLHTIMARTFGGQMGGKEAVARTRHTGDGDARRRDADHAFARQPVSDRVAAIGDQHPVHAQIQHRLRGGSGVGQVAMGQHLGFKAVQIESTMGRADQGGQPFGLAGAGGHDAQIGMDQARLVRDARQLVHGQVAVDHRDALPRCRA